MKLSSFRICGSQAVVALLAMLGSAGTMHAAAQLTMSATTVNLYCSATNPSFPVVVSLTAISAPLTGKTLTVSAPAVAPTGFSVVLAGAVIPPANTPATATFTAPAGCTPANGAGAKSYILQSLSSAASSTIQAENPITVNIYNTNFLTATIPSSATVVSLSCIGGVAGSPVSVTLKAPNVPTTSTITTALAGGTAPTLFTVSAPATLTMTGASLGTGIVYTFTPATNCNNTSQPFTSQTYTFRAYTTVAAVPSAPATAAADVSVTVVLTSSATSTLVAAPVTLKCTKAANGTYSQQGHQDITITSGYPGGVSYTWTASGIPGWLGVSTYSGTRTTTPASGSTYTLTVDNGCGGFAAGTSTTANIHLVTTGPITGVSDKVMAVTLMVVSPTNLHVTSPASMTYKQKSGTPGTLDVPVNATGAPLTFTVDTSTLPYWLTVDYTTATTPKTIRFSSTNAADLMPPGAYQGSVLLKVAGQSDTTMVINMQINSQAPTLSVSSPTPTITWTIGDPIPTATIKLVSTGGAIPYSITSSGVLAPAIADTVKSGLAYSFGTQIPVTFDQTAFASAQANSQLNGLVSVAWGTNPTITSVVAFVVNVQSPLATLNSIYPASIAAATAPTTYTLTLTGAGFIVSPDSSISTHVGISTNGVYSENSNFTVRVTDSSHINLSIAVPAVATSYLPFDTATSAQVILSVCNPVGGVCNSVNPGSTTAFTIGSVPSITTVTSASAFIQPTTVAPFDIISLFGFNFCPTCSSNQILTGTLDPKALVYPSTLSDGRTPAKSLVVTFKKHAGTGTMADVTAPLLFATNNQINLLVPSTVSSLTGSASVDIMVTFGGVDSQVFNVPVATTNPGIFTIGSDGQGSGAILASDYSLVTQASPAAVRTGVSDTVQIYMSGLGMPWTGLLNSDAGTGQGAAGGHWSADCISTASYTDLLNSATGGTYTIDGAVIQYSLMNGKRLAPCLSSAAGFVTATVGGIDSPVSYAGWVPDSVAGLYQVNVTLPLANTAMKVNPSDASAADVTQTVSLPVIVKIGNGGSAPTSQSGVTIAVVKRLTVAPPAPLSSTIGVAYTSTTSVVATGGTGTYTYKLTSGQLPLGLKFNTDGSISGTPAIYTSGSYILTVTATDTASVTGTVTFTLTVLGGLGMSSSTTNPITSTFNTASPSLATITATGGVGAYTYTIAAPLTSLFNVPSADNGVTGTLGIPATTPAGTYNVTVHAADSTTGTALQGDITLPVAVALNITASTTPRPTGTSTGVLATMVTTNSGKTGTLSYTLDAASIAAGLAIDPVSGAISVGSALPQTRSGVVRATDSGTATGAVASSHAVADIPFTVTVTALGALTITTPAAVAASTGSATTVPLTATGGTGPYTFATVGNANTCTISGSTLTIPSGLSVGSFDIAVTVTDNNGLTSVLTITVTVS